MFQISQCEIDEAARDYENALSSAIRDLEDWKRNEKESLRPILEVLFDAFDYRQRFNELSYKYKKERREVERGY